MCSLLWLFDWSNLTSWRKCADQHLRPGRGSLCMALGNVLWSKNDWQKYAIFTTFFWCGPLNKQLEKCCFLRCDFNSRVYWQLFRHFVLLALIQCIRFWIFLTSFFFVSGTNLIGFFWWVWSSTWWSSAHPDGSAACSHWQPTTGLRSRCPPGCG